MNQDSTSILIGQDSTEIQKTIKPIISPFMESLSIQIIGGVIAFLVGLIIIFYWKKIALKFGNKSSKLSLSDIELKYNDSEIEKKLNIIVIDDDDIFPVQGFKDFGYTIDKWDSIDTMKLKSLQMGDFDIIVLDIVGVAKEIAKGDGFEILENLKTNNPAQVIIAYSGQTFDISKNDFWLLADEKLGKPTPFLSTQELLHNLIRQKFQIPNYIRLIKEKLESSNQLEKYSIIENLILTSIKSNTQPNWNRELESINNNNNVRSQVIEISKSLIKIVKLK